MTVLPALLATLAALLALLPRRVPARSPVHADLVGGRPADTRTIPAPLRHTGRMIRTALGRAPDPVLDTRVGAAVAALASVVAVGPVPTLAAAAAVVLVRRLRRLRRARAQAADDTVQAALPDLIDLLALAIGAGHTIPSALPVVTRWAPPALRDDLEAATAAFGRGAPIADVLDRLQDAWGIPARPLVRALRDHVRHGLPLLPTLERVGGDARDVRRRAAETRARRLPVLLLFPLVFCTLPAFGLLTVAPIVAGTLRSLDGERLETAVSTTYRTENPPCTHRSSPPSSPSCRPSPPSATPSASTSMPAATRAAATAASPRPSTPSSCSARPPSRSCSSPGPASRVVSSASSTPSSTR